MERAAPKAKLPSNVRRETQRMAENEDEAVVRVPLVVRVAPIRVEPPSIIVVFDVEDVQVAVRIGVVWDAAITSSPILYSIVPRRPTR